MADFEKDMQMARQIAVKVQELGGRVFYVGGYVRDTLLHRENKDIDIEVHGILPAQLEKVLDGCGQRLEMGANFGIFALKGYSLDISMPRDEAGAAAPFIGAANAARRRDFTCNALMQDVLTSEIIDRFGGVNDLNNKILRHTPLGTKVGKLK